MKTPSLLSVTLWLALALVVMAAIRFAVMFGTGPIHDEAYYWSWSQRLDFGYYDQPFLTGWVLAPFVAVLGDHAWVLRLVATLLTMLTSLFLVLSALLLREAMSGEHRYRSSALPGLLLLCLTSPLLWGVGLLYVHDTVMLCALSAGLWLGLRALSEPAGIAARIWWIGSGAALALAFSAKVSAALWIAALGLALVVHPTGWRHLRTLGPWIAAGLIVGAVGLFVGWNALNGWVTFVHVGGEHLAPSKDQPLSLSTRSASVGLGVVASLLLAGPAAVGVFLLAVVSAKTASPLRPKSLRGVQAGVLAVVLFSFLPLAAFLALAWTRDIYLNWLLPSAFGLTLLGAVYWPTRINAWHVAASAPSALLSLALLLPIALREPRFMLANARDMLGWEGSMALLVTYRDEGFPDHEIAGNYYHLAAQVAFHLKDVKPSIGRDPRSHQFALYQDKDGKLGGPLLVLAPSLAAGKAALEPDFCHVRPLVPWPVNDLQGGKIAEPYLFDVQTPKTDATPCPR